jgi:hypothetical protein
VGEAREPGLAVAGAAAAGVILATSGSAVSPTRPHREILVPATVPPKVDECTEQLLTAADGTVGPLKCPGGKLNTLAWQYYAKFDPQVMSLGPFATEGEVARTVCSDLKNSNIGTRPKETEAYQISALYYGWRFVLPADPASLGC